MHIRLKYSMAYESRGPKKKHILHKSGGTVETVKTIGGKPQTRAIKKP